MGLDVSHDAWSGAYSRFNRFRVELCNVCGLGNLERYEGFGGQKPWPTKEEEPATILLNHSDCDGEISTADCAPLAVRLRAIVAFLPNWDWAPEAIRFAEGCEAAAAANEPLEFM